MIIAVFTELFLLPALLVSLRVGQVAVQLPLPTGDGSAPTALLARRQSARAED
jgi:hypothetical protein